MVRELRRVTETEAISFCRELHDRIGVGAYRNRFVRLLAVAPWSRAEARLLWRTARYLRGVHRPFGSQAYFAYRFLHQVATLQKALKTDTPCLFWQEGTCQHIASLGVLDGTGDRRPLLQLVEACFAEVPARIIYLQSAPEVAWERIRSRPVSGARWPWETFGCPSILRQFAGTLDTVCGTAETAGVPVHRIDVPGAGNVTGQVYDILVGSRSVPSMRNGVLTWP